MRLPTGLLAVALAIGCRAHTREPVTPWLRMVYWHNRTIIAESGGGRGIYIERKDADGDWVKLEGSRCESLAAGEAVLCIGPNYVAFVLWRDGKTRTIDCGSTRDRTTYRVGKVGEREIACVHNTYGGRLIQVLAIRQDLDGRELGRRKFFTDAEGREVPGAGSAAGSAPSSAPAPAP